MLKINTHLESVANQFQLFLFLSLAWKGIWKKHWLFASYRKAHSMEHGLKEIVCFIKKYTFIFSALKVIFWLLSCPENQVFFSSAWVKCVANVIKCENLQINSSWKSENRGRCCAKRFSSSWVSKFQTEKFSSIRSKNQLLKMGLDKNSRKIITVLWIVEANFGKN